MKDVSNDVLGVFLVLWCEERERKNGSVYTAKCSRDGWEAKTR